MNPPRREDCKNVTIHFTGGRTCCLMLDPETYDAFLNEIDCYQHNAQDLVFMSLNSWEYQYKLETIGQDSCYEFLGLYVCRVNISQIIYIATWEN